MIFVFNLKDILEKHRKWLYEEPGGEQADLRYANLSYADLRYANLSYANLSYADLRYANLSYADLRFANLIDADLRSANLRSANLRFANLRSANLRSANLSEIKDDFFKKLKIVKTEAPGLYDYLIKGKINGVVYEGECACFVGTVAKVCNQNYEKLESGLKPNIDSPTERWFLAILPGDNEKSNQVVAITKEWIEEFAKVEGIELPQYKIVSSNDFPGAFE